MTANLADGEDVGDVELMDRIKLHARGSWVPGRQTSAIAASFYNDQFTQRALIYVKDSFGARRAPARSTEHPSRRDHFAAKGTEAECETQYKLDSVICRMVQTPLPSSSTQLLSMTMIVAERTLILHRSGQDLPVAIQIYQPVKQDNAWGSRWTIQWPDRLRASEAFGHDSAQALLHALQSIGADLYASAEHLSGGLRWTDHDSGYGFPVPGIIRDRLKGDDAEYL